MIFSVFAIFVIMKMTDFIYIAPAIEAMAFEAEQSVFSLSGLGDTEELLEDPDDYTDFFE